MSRIAKFFCRHKWHRRFVKEENEYRREVLPDGSETVFSRDFKQCACGVTILRIHNSKTEIIFGRAESVLDLQLNETEAS